MKIATLDIETSPNLADVWSLWKTNISVDQLRERGGVICYASKWYGKRGVDYFSTYHDGEEAMVNAAWTLLDDADAIVHFNGEAFDIPHLQRMFLLHDMPPPSPFRQIDLVKVARRQFRFASNRLQNLSIELGLGAKVKHEGHDLWVRCLAGDDAAWNLMRKYNKHDVVLTEKLYDKLLPWIQGHPHYGLYNGFASEDICGRCGPRGELKPRGYARTQVGIYQKYRCEGCGSWSRGKRAIETVGARPV